MGDTCEATVSDELTDGLVVVADTHPLHRESVKQREGDIGRVIMTNDDECCVSFPPEGGERVEPEWIRSQWLEPFDEPDGVRVREDDIEVPGCYRLVHSIGGDRKYLFVEENPEQEGYAWVYHWHSHFTDETYLGRVKSHLRGDWNAYRLPQGATLPIDADALTDAPIDTSTVNTYTG